MLVVDVRCETTAMGFLPSAYWAIAVVSKLERYLNTCYRSISSGIILSDIKVLLSYLDCNVTNDSNASWFIRMHTKTRKRLSETTWKIASYCNIRNFYGNKEDGVLCTLPNTRSYLWQPVITSPVIQQRLEEPQTAVSP